MGRRARLQFPPGQEQDLVRPPVSEEEGDIDDAQSMDELAILAGDHVP